MYVHIFVTEDGEPPSAFKDSQELPAPTCENTAVDLDSGTHTEVDIDRKCHRSSAVEVDIEGSALAVNLCVTSLLLYINAIVSFDCRRCENMLVMLQILAVHPVLS